MAAMSSPRVCVVIVTWHPGPEFATCIASLQAAREHAKIVGVEVELVVVDNASAAFPHDEITRRWPDAIIVHNDTNRGFGPACNQGAAAGSAEFVLFLNPDTAAEGDPFSPIVATFDARAEVVALAPRLVEEVSADANGSHAVDPSATNSDAGGSGGPSSNASDSEAGRFRGPSSSANDRHANESQAGFQLRRLPTLPQTARELLLVDQLWPASPWLRADRYGDADRDASFAVEQPAAAALAIRRDVFERIGGFDESYLPAWFEDVDLCERLAGVGPILYLPASRFRHLGGVSSARLGYDRFLPIYHRNALRFWRRRRGPVAALVVRALIVAGMVMRLGLLPLRRRVPRSRSEAARAYLRTLAVAIRPVAALDNS